MAEKLRRHLVVGAAGTAGKQVTTDLLARGQQVRAMVRREEQARRLEGSGVEAVIGDLDHPRTLDAPFKEIDAVYILTSANARAADQAMNAIDAARRSGVRHIVRHSTGRVYAESPFPTARDHARVETYLKLSGVPFTLVRTHWYMQNMLLYAESIKKESLFRTPFNDGRIGMVDLRDLSEVIVDSMVEGRNLGLTLTITGPETLSMADCAARISDTVGRQITAADMSIDEFRNGLVGTGMSEFTLNEYVIYFNAIKDGWGDFTSDDFVTATGHGQRTFAAFASDHAAAFVAPEEAQTGNGRARGGAR